MLHNTNIFFLLVGEDVNLDVHQDDSEVTLNVCLGKEFTGRFIRPFFLFFILLSILLLCWVLERQHLLTVLIFFLQGGTLYFEELKEGETEPDDNSNNNNSTQTPTHTYTHHVGRAVIHAGMRESSFVCHLFL